MSISYQLTPSEPALDSFDDILDQIVLLINQCMSQHESTAHTSRQSPFLFVIRDDRVHEVLVLKKDVFAKMFDELIALLHTHYKALPVNLASPTLKSLYQELLEHVGSAMKIAEDVMLNHGGSMFPMFPSCVGYVLTRQHESLFCVQPSEMYEIDDEVFRQYVLQVMREHFN